MLGNVCMQMFVGVRVYCVCLCMCVCMFARESIEGD